jgi:hypothetical protein
MYLSKKIIVPVEHCDENKEGCGKNIRCNYFYIKNGYLETSYFMKLGGKKQEFLIKNGTI